MNQIREILGLEHTLKIPPKGNRVWEESMGSREEWDEILTKKNPLLLK